MITEKVSFIEPGYPERCHNHCFKTNCFRLHNFISIIYSEEYLMLSSTKVVLNYFGLFVGKWQFCMIKQKL
jgi:hypothetical protein